MQQKLISDKMQPWTEQVTEQGNKDPAFRAQFTKILKQFQTKKISEKKFSQQIIKALKESTKRTKVKKT